MKRRDFLKRATLTAGATLLGGLSACGSADDDGGAATSCSPSTYSGSHDDSVAHLLPTVSSDRIYLKVSFFEAQSTAPEFLVDGCAVAGRPTDSAGFFWSFDAAGLDSGRRYTLELRREGRYLIDPWQLSTFPAPNRRPERFRLLIYGCAGGWDGFGIYVPVPLRRRLLRRALDFEPDAAVASGDHSYWILRTGIPIGSSPLAIEYAGMFDRMSPVLGTPNEEVLKLAVGPQVADLYGTMFRSLPVFFIRDDHDYFEDDRITGDLVPFPAGPFMRDLARSAQWLYYPEFLPDRNRPSDLPASGAPDRPAGVSEAFGTLRYGRLFEGLLYDCKGFLSLQGEDGTIVPPQVERWLVARMADPSADHVVNLPSNPPGWSAGKFAEWYPDVLGPDGALTTDLPKEGWQPGWLAQHDRLLSAASAMNRVPLFMAADIHSIAEERILASGSHDFSRNPVVSVIAGPPGTYVGWPSAARGTLAAPPNALTVEEIVPVREDNGFQIVDFEPERVTIRHFRWKYKIDSDEAIDTLMPSDVSVHERT